MREINLLLIVVVVGGGGGGGHFPSKSYLVLLIPNLFHLHDLYLIYKLVLFAAMMYDVTLSK